MFKKMIFIFLSLYVLQACTSIIEPNPLVTSESSSNGMDLFLLAGQSNMAGRGIIGEVDKVTHPRVLAFSKGMEWKPASAPIHFDKKQAGVGLATSFAADLIEQNSGMTIGLIPAACGGSSLDVWLPGAYHSQTNSHPYDDAIARAKSAMKSGNLKAILWHQGESDSNEHKSPLYKERLVKLIQRFREELNSPQLPFIIGQLGQFEQHPWNNSQKQVNKAHIEISKEIPFVAFVPSDGLTPNKDNIHFNSASLKIFGLRYAEAYEHLTTAQ